MLCLVLLLVAGTPARAEQWILNNYIVIVDNFVLKKVIATPASSSVLNLSNKNLRSIDEGAFGNLEIQKLLLAHNHLENLPLFVFHQLGNVLEYLSLANNTLRNLYCVFGGLRKLKVLDLRYNGITEFGNGSLYGLEEIEEIGLDVNEDTVISPESFSRIANINFIPLSLCIADGVVRSLEVFDEKTGQPETDGCIVKIRPFAEHSVQLCGEEITRFEEGWYRLHELIVTSLNLRNNRIASITRTILNDLPEEVIDVDLSVNQITNIQAGKIDNPHLRKLDLSENFIEIIEAHALDKTENLEVILSGNKLSDIELIDYLECMVHVDYLPGTDIPLRYIVNPHYPSELNLCF